MQIGPSCYQPAPGREISVRGLWYPYQNDLIVARQQEVFAGNPEDVVVSEEGSIASGRRLFTMPPMDSSSWMEIDIRPQGTIFNNEVQFGPATVANVSTGVKWTPARARITWTEQGGAQQSVDVDIGAGTNFVVPPTNQVWVDLLVPNPATLENVVVPSTIPPDVLARVEYITTVSCKVTCVSSPGGNRACLTRLIYLGPDGLRPSGAAPTRSQYVLAPRGTKTVDVFIGQSGPGGPGGDPVPLIGDILLRWETLAALGRINQPSGASPLPDLFLDVFPSARFQQRGDSSVPQWQTGPVAYPGSAYSNIRAHLQDFSKTFILTFKFTLDI